MSVGIKFKLGPPPDAHQSDHPAHDIASQDDRDFWSRHFKRIRLNSLQISSPLSPEDQVIQSMPDASPMKWHLAHTTWFFETFLLKTFHPAYEEFEPWFAHLFNSYYYSIGSMHERPRRGLLSRPSHCEVLAYRAHVDAAMGRLLVEASSQDWEEIRTLTEIGLNHEQQHQELMLTDIKHALSCNPMAPAAYAEQGAAASSAQPMTWHQYEGGIRSFGADPSRFFYDNEGPRHEVLLRPFALASRPVTNGEYLAFIEDGGYETVSLWLSDGWDAVCAQTWRHPLYWTHQDGRWQEFTLAGSVDLDLNRPVAHISYFEAQAYAAWAGKRLPTEYELEHALGRVPAQGHLLDCPSDPDQPIAAPEPQGAPAGPGADHSGGAGAGGTVTGPRQLFGDVWEWTASPYSPYPGFRPLNGALGEYNGKFMCNQFVLKGGSSATPADHIRPSYRNFFPPQARWQFSGIRLAEDVAD